ncbi:MAG: electron transport complex subunit G [Cycloclasticus sp. symbiont of Poecilosclerida sp. M]|nr:MAG: electron transport complex subunit G [Cycloclasticus sp. symbiont of Poecilosclerida sp. M]
MSAEKKSILKAGLILGLFSFVGLGLVSYTHQMTYEKIAENERLFIIKNLRELVPDELHDNDLLESSRQISDANAFGTDTPVTIYPAIKSGTLTAVILSPTAPDGYNGSIKLLVAISRIGKLLGVRVVSHHETPGLGDAVDTNKSDWVYAFNGHSLSDPSPKYWRVKRDGGIFDQFTGATITPRAVVKAVFNTLTYYQKHKGALALGKEHTKQSDE